MSETHVEPSTSGQNVPAQARSRSATPVDTSMPPTIVQAVQLDSGQGKTIIADTVVAKIAAAAAREVDGVHDLVPLGAGAALAGIAGRLTRADQRTSGVSVEVGQREAAVDLNVTVDYGVSIPQVADAVRQNIINRVRSMTGLNVKEVNLNASDLYFPEEHAAAQARVQ
ncbi:MAG TPA: Asp23/Gls24 family envelope stress response protein [Ktedonobacterales bacterium]